MVDRSNTRPFPLVPLVVGLIVILGIVAVLLSRGGENADSEDQARKAVTSQLAETRPVSIVGPALSPFAEGADRAVGTLAPQVNGSSFSGQPVAIANDGVPKVLVFLAHWCPHCQKEVPVISKWIAENGLPDDVSLVSVATATASERPNYPPSEWLDREGWRPAVLADDAQGTAATAYGLTAFPYFVVLDAQGMVVHRVSGELTAKQFEDLLDKARSGGN